VKAKFLFGKVPTTILQKIVFKHLGIKRKDVILGPKIGEDAAIVKAGKNILAIATDPITGAEKRIGWLAENVSANDVATCGVVPRWFTSCILLPEKVREDLIEDICSQIGEAARKLRIAVIAGHCEITPNLNRPIVIGCSIGIAENGKYVTSSGAKPGNEIILTKGAGIEGTGILASDKREILLSKFGEEFVDRAEEFFKKISVVDDAIIAFKTGEVTAMHDPTEGGIAGGLNELADASKVGFEVYEKNIEIAEETQKICSFFRIDPLRLISSGSLLITCEKGRSGDIIENLRKRGITASIIGSIIKQYNKRIIVTRTGKRLKLTRPISDHLWKALAKA
jgi:hydrogenase maturation factor